MVLTKENAARALWQKKVIEADAYLSDVAPELCGDCPDFFPKEIIEKNVIEKIFNSGFELDWIPKGLRLLDLKKDPNLFYQYEMIDAPDSSPRGDLATIPWPLTRVPDRGAGNEIRHVRRYWWGSQKFAQEKVGGYWVLWLPDIYCLNQPAAVQKGPCEDFAKRVFELTERAGQFPHITELVYLLLLHKHREENYAKDANFIGNFIRSGTPLSADINIAGQSDLLLAAGWKLSQVSENADLNLMLVIDNFPFYAAFKNVGVVPFISLK